MCSIVNGVGTPREKILIYRWEVRGVEMFIVNERNVLQQSFFSFARLGFCFNTSYLRVYYRPKELEWVVKWCMGVELHQLGVHLLSQIVSYSIVVSQIIWGSYQAFLFMKILRTGTLVSMNLCTCFCVQACACSLEILFTRSINNWYL